MNSLLALLEQPYSLLFLLLGVGIIESWRRRREPIRRLLVVTLSFVALAVLSMPAIAHLSLGTLEWRYPPTEERPDDAEAIVVLGGGVDPADATRLRAEMNSATLWRCLHAAAVYRRGKPCPVVVCGGRVDTGSSTPPVAQLMRDFLRDQGINDGDLIVEDRSRSTYENAVECRGVLAEADQQGDPHYRCDPYVPCPTILLEARDRGCALGLRSPRHAVRVGFV